MLSMYVVNIECWKILLQDLKIVAPVAMRMSPEGSLPLQSEGVDRGRAFSG